MPLGQRTEWRCCKTWVRAEASIPQVGNSPADSHGQGGLWWGLLQQLLKLQQLLLLQLLLLELLLLLLLVEHGG